MTDALPNRVVELPICGMDCIECTRHVQRALAAVAGVESVEVFLTSEKAILRLDPTRVTSDQLQRAVQAAGYALAGNALASGEESRVLTRFTRLVLPFLGLFAGIVLLLLVAGEWLGLFARITDLIPWPYGWGIVLLAGSPIFWNVGRAALHRHILSHTLMSIGVIAALAVGQWPTAAVVVFFMHSGNVVESFTTERSRRATKHLTSLVPKMAHILRQGEEVEVSVAEVQVGDTVIIRPGEALPVDGDVVSGQATIDQAAITGEAREVEAGEGMHLFAATIARCGSVRLRATHVGAETTFGKIIKLVEEAEAHRGSVQRLADRFSSYFLPVVVAIALLTFLIGRNLLATASVLVVACSCSFALATPIAMLASIGMSAQRGLLIKGGKYVEELARADVLLIDKTGTITSGHPQITDIVALNGQTASDLLQLCANCERYSEHPLARAIRREAVARGLQVRDPAHFEAVPGQGIRACIDGAQIAVGNAHLIPQASCHPQASALQQQGKTLLFVTQDNLLIGLLAAADTLRPEVPPALARARTLGVKQIELLTGDHAQVASSLAHQLGIKYRAGLLPEEKLAVVQQYQAQGHIVVMVGDGVNDAPALAQANVGIAMGVAGTDVALDAAHLAVMRDDWELVPDAFAIARRTMRVVKINLGFTVLYNLVGLSLAASGLLPPIFAAAAQSLPDLGILANSAQLLRQITRQPAITQKHQDMT
jgi:Cu+-exporting ATPase